MNCAHAHTPTHSISHTLQAHFANYSHLALPGLRVSNGNLWTRTVGDVPLIAGYNRQFALSGYYVTVKVEDALVP